MTTNYLYVVRALHKSGAELFVSYNKDTRILELSEGEPFYFSNPAKAHQAAKDYYPKVSGVVGVRAPGWSMFIGKVPIMKPFYDLVW